MGSDEPLSRYEAKYIRGRRRGNIKVPKNVVSDTDTEIFIENKLVDPVCPHRTTETEIESNQPLSRYEGKCDARLVCFWVHPCWAGSGVGFRFVTSLRLHLLYLHG